MFIVCYGTFQDRKHDALVNFNRRLVLLSYKNLWNKSVNDDVVFKDNLNLVKKDKLYEFVHEVYCSQHLTKAYLKVFPQDQNYIDVTEKENVTYTKSYIRLAAGRALQLWNSTVVQKIRADRKEKLQRKFEIETADMIEMLMSIYTEAECMPNATTQRVRLDCLDRIAKLLDLYTPTRFTHEMNVVELLKERDLSNG